MAQTYQPIPGLGTGRNFLQVALRSRIFRGADHMLIMQSTGYTEEYKRIFYRDIRYVEIRKSRRQLWIGVISGGMTLFFLLLYAMKVPGGVAITLGLPFLIVFLVNLFKGPTCECYISTSVQTLKIPTPRRMNKVDTLVAFLRAQTAAFTPSEAPQPAP